MYRDAVVTLRLLTPSGQSVIRRIVEYQHSLVQTALTISLVEIVWQVTCQRYTEEARGLMHLLQTLSPEEHLKKIDAHPAP
jgi:hypothetical protein